MSVKIIEIEPNEVKSPPLRSIARHLSGISKIFLAKIEQQEVGIMIVDLYDPPYPLFIYYIYVASNFRRQGIGSKLLSFAERMASKRGNPSVALQPNEIEKDYSIQTLRSWYIRRGYSDRESDPKRMAKIISH
jgi:GNAT superfamily N-acetyltransferase